MYCHKEGESFEGINPLRRRSLQSIILRAVYLQQDKKSQNVAPLDYQLIHSLAQILRAFEKFKSTSPQSSLMTYHLSLFTHTYIHHEFPIDSHDGLHLWPLARAVLAWETLHLLLLSPHLRQSWNGTSRASVKHLTIRFIMNFSMFVTLFTTSPLPTHSTSHFPQFLHSLS